MVIQWNAFERGVKGKRCNGRTRVGRRCRARTKADHYCHMHAGEQAGVYVDASRIPGARNGLYAGRNFKKNEVVTTYAGKIVNQAYLDRKYPGAPAEYALRVGPDRYLDAEKPTTCFGRFINSSGGGNKGFRQANVRFCQPPRGHQATQSNIRANRNIKSGQELLVSYGEGEGLGYAREGAHGAPKKKRQTATKSGPRRDRSPSPSEHGIRTRDLEIARQSLGQHHHAESPDLDPSVFRW